MQESKNQDISLLRFFFKFLRKPQVKLEDSSSFLTRFFNVIRLWSFVFAIGIFSVLIANIFLESIGYDSDEFALNEFMSEVSPFVFLFILVFVGPLAEEIAFRLGLKYSPARWAISLPFFIFFVLMFFDISIIPKGMLDVGGFGELVYLILAFVVSSFLLYIFLRIKNISIFIEGLFISYFPFVFYSLSICFAFIHISNYQDDWFGLVYLAPILVLPQFLLSLIMGFFRVYYNFFWAYFIHMFNNLLIGLLVVLFMPIVLKQEELSELDESLEIYHHLSLVELSLVSIGMMLFFLMNLVVAFCLFSLFLEYFRERKISRLS